jgi:CHAT domain-containing protein
MPLTRGAVAEELVLLRTPVGPGLGLEADQPASALESGPSSDRPRLTYLLGKDVGGPPHFPRFAEVVTGVEDRYHVVTNFLSEKGWEDLSRAEIRKRVAGAQVVHFLCHGNVDAARGISLEIGSRPLGSLRPEHVWNLQLEPGALVVVSACSSAASGFTPAGVRSFGWNFVRAGASVYLGTLAPVTPTVAMAFARTFFDARLRDQLGIAEAIRRARRQTARGDDPTWMFYVVYGDPNREPTQGDA